jgi:hypothetical protein
MLTLTVEHSQNKDQPQLSCTRTYNKTGYKVIRNNKKDTGGPLSATQKASTQGET